MIPITTAMLRFYTNSNNKDIFNTKCINSKTFNNNNSFNFNSNSTIIMPIINKNNDNVSINSSSNNNCTETTMAQCPATTVLLHLHHRKNWTEMDSVSVRFT